MVEAEDVERAAENARISLSDDEKEEFANQFEDVLEKFDSLQEVDTEDFDPAFHPVEDENSRRPDKIEESISKKQAFQNTANIEEDKFKGPSS